MLVGRLGDGEDVGRQRAEARRAVAAEKALVVERPRDLPVCVCVYFVCSVLGKWSSLAGWPASGSKPKLGQADLPAALILP